VFILALRIRRRCGIVFSEALAEGAVVFAEACELAFEGTVSKREESFYPRARTATG
jgi:ATP-dependent DNA ligase